MDKSWWAYWRRAWKAKPPTSKFSLYRAIPSVLIVIIQIVFRAQRSIKEMFATTLIIVAVYIVLYALETVWNFVSLAPVRLDQLAQQSVDKQNVGPLEQQRQYLVAQRMEELTIPQQDAVHYILLHGETSVQNLRQSLGITYSELKPIIQKSLIREDDRVCFINPELHNALESYFRNH
jgi:hypothetical protein